MWRKVWIWKRELKKGAVYCLRWNDDFGRVKTETIGPDKKLVERILRGREEQLNSGMLRTVPNIALSEFTAEELEMMKGQLSKGSIDILRQTLTEFIEAVGNRKLKDITPKMIESYFSGRLQERKRATANKHLRTLKASLNRAVRRGYLQHSPARDIKQVREQEKAMRVLSTEEVEALLRACPSLRWKALVALGVSTGMRIGELLALEWSDLDLDKGVVQVINKPGHSTKSRKNRYLALMPEVRDLLGQLSRKGTRVFHTPAGKPWGNNVRRDFNAIVKKSGILRCTFHDLRRTFASHLAMNGVNEAVVQKLTGHANIQTTLKHYTNILPDSLRAAQATLPFGKAIRDVSDTYHGGKSAKTRKTA